MKRLLRRLLFLLAIVIIVATGLLAYSFVPKTLRMDTSLETGIGRGRKDPAALPEAKLSIIKAGKMPAKQSFSYRGGSWTAPYENGMAAILVQHPNGSLLFDTGFGSNVAEHWKTIPRLMRALSSYVPETPAATQLRSNGIDPATLKMAVISHSHWDHISGLEDLPGLEVWMPRDEVAFIRSHKYPGLIDQMVDRLKIHEFEFTSGPYENFETSLDVFGDGSVVLVPLPGHTPGSTGMFVNLHSGRRFLFIGDLTWSREGIEIPAERPWLARVLVDMDDAQVRRSILRVHSLRRADGSLVVVPAHDRRVHDTLAAFPASEH
jgi:glyoxylase-like metal-dependent hydrolase (beta-lactamase superfamily II)